MTSAARSPFVGSLQREPGSVVIEREDLEGVGAVALTAVSSLELARVRIIPLMASQAQAFPSGPVQGLMVERLHHEVFCSMAQATALFRESPFMGIFTPVTDHAGLWILEPEDQPPGIRRPFPFFVTG
jgi:hypothetical protein